MDTMAIAAMSMQMSSARLGQAVGLSVMKKAMNDQEAAANQLLNMLPQGKIAPSSGHIIDTLA